MAGALNNRISGWPLPHWPRSGQGGLLLRCLAQVQGVGSHHCALQHVQRLCSSTGRGGGAGGSAVWGKLRAQVLRRNCQTVRQAQPQRGTPSQ